MTKGRVISIEIFNLILFNNITVPKHFTSALKVEDFDNFLRMGPKCLLRLPHSMYSMIRPGRSGLLEFEKKIVLVVK